MRPKLQNAALRGVIDWVSFDDDKIVDVILYGGGKAYRFQNGNFLNAYDMMELLRVP